MSSGHCRRAARGAVGWPVLLGLLVAAVFGAGPGHAQIKPAPLAAAEAIDITAAPIEHFQRSRPDQRRFGRLEWRGGLVLGSPSAHFGGWSGLVLDAKGQRLLALSDAGAWLAAELVYDGDRPSGIRAARIGPLLASGPKRLSRLRDRDAEAMTLVAGTVANGTLLIAFERNHRIARFRVEEGGVAGGGEALAVPAEAARMNRNQGFEAVAVIAAGRLAGSVVAFSERLADARGHLTGWLWVRGVPQRFYLTDYGFDISDAAALPDGGLLVLERRFRWTEGVRIRLRHVAAEELAPERVIAGEALLEADMGFEIDNMEGIAVHRGRRGETVITLISDDNFNQLLQRTLLLQFRLLEDGEASLADRTRTR